VNDEVVILNRETEQVHRLNVTASYIWDLCDGANTPEQIAAQMAAVFDRTEHQMIGDVRATIAQLRELGLIASD
jgi:hypothetical protein